MCGTMSVAAPPPADHKRPDARDGRSTTRRVSALMYACQQGDVDRVRRILRRKPLSVFRRDRTGKTPLHYCSNSNYVNAAQAADLLAMAAPDLLDGADDDGFTPLHLAVIAGNMPLVTFLLANNADVNAVDNERHTVVHWATVCGETEALRAVLSAGAPASTPDIHGGYPLHYAAQMCGGFKDSTLGLQVLETLLTHPEVTPSVEDGDGRQPLLWAASAGSSKALLALVKSGAAVESSDKDGLTALHCAASRGHTDCIETLLSLCGASPDVIDGNGCTALHYAVTLGHADATALLLGAGSNPNRQDRKGRSPGHCGCAKGQLETVKMLGAHGANLWLRNARGDLPLHEAAASGRRELVKWLLEQRPSQVNARNNDGRCPLHLAALNDNADMCKILIDAGAQVNPILRTSKNVFMTPLDCALQRGFRSTAKYLQLNGGLPATRVGGLRQSEPNLSSGNLNIRDDITFWGDTSDSEKELSVKKRGYRKKVSGRLHRRREKSKKETDELSKEDVKKVSYTKQVEAVNGEIKYKTDIMVNGKPAGFSKTGQSVVLEQKKLPSARVAPSKLPVPCEKEGKQRPKSAKSRKPLDKSTIKISTPTSPKKDDFVQVKMIPLMEDKSISTVEEKSTYTIEDKATWMSEELDSAMKIKESTMKIAEDNKLSDVQIIGKTVQQDQFSTISNTSVEDSEAQKQFVVEAAVHSPPKELSGGIEESEIVEGTSKVAEISKDIHRSSEEIVKTGEASDSNVDGKSNYNSIDISRNGEEAQDEIYDSSKVDENEETTTAAVKETGKNDSTEKILQPIEQNSTDSKGKIELSTTEDQIDLVDHPKIHPSSEDKKISEATQELQENKIQSEMTEEAVQMSSNDSPTKATVDVKPNTPLDVSKEDTRQLRPLSARRTQRLNTQQSMMIDSSIETKSSEDDTTLTTSSSDQSVRSKEHKSFRVLEDGEATKSNEHKKKHLTRKSRSKEKRSKSEEPKRHKPKSEASKIPTSGKDEETGSESQILSLPYIQDEKSSKDSRQLRSESNLSVPIVSTAYSDNERDSDFEEILSSATRKKRLRKRAKARGAKSAGSDYESSNLIDSGFEPSPRTSHHPKCKNVSDRSVNMASVTQNIQTNIRRYHLERKIFQHLLDLKRLQIRAGQHNEAMLVKRAIDAYHKSCAATVGAGRYTPEDYTFRSFERFLYQSLRKLQKNGADHLKGLPETPDNPLLCTQSTHRCLHATHAYTGIPCAAYLPKMDHHTIPKIGFDCKPSGFLPNIHQQKKGVTLELCHGNDRQIISLPTDRLDQNKRYYVTFTVKGQENTSGNEELPGHVHAKSD